MNTRRLTTTGVALVAALSLGLTGCGNSGSGGGTASPSASASSAAPTLAPRDELTAAVQKLNEETVKVNFAMTGFSGQGAMDPAAKKMRISGNLGLGGEAMKMDMIVLGEDIYLKMDGLATMSDKWQHIDASKLPAGSQLRQMSGGDPVGANNLLSGVTEVRRVGEGRYQGTLDATKSTAADPEALRVFGDKAKAVPFTASLDERGRLTELTVDMQSLHQSLGQMKTTYSDFGVPVSVEKPAAGQIEEAPAELLRAFGS
jgi:hypothetical protein